MYMIVPYHTPPMALGWLVVGIRLKMVLRATIKQTKEYTYIQ